jgi:threonine aldolase
MGRKMRFFSDNAAAACPEVMAALLEANSLDTAYDGEKKKKKK